MQNEMKQIKIYLDMPMGYLVIQPCCNDSMDVIKVDLAYYKNGESISLITKDIFNRDDMNLVLSEIKKLLPQKYFNRINKFLGSLIFRPSESYSSYYTRILNLVTKHSIRITFHEKEDLYQGLTNEKYQKKLEEKIINDLLVTLKDLARYHYELAPVTIREDHVNNVITNINYKLSLLYPKGLIDSCGSTIKILQSPEKLTKKEIGDWAYDMMLILTDKEKNYDSLWTYKE